MLYYCSSSICPWIFFRPVVRTEIACPFSKLPKIIFTRKWKCSLALSVPSYSESRECHFARLNRDSSGWEMFFSSRVGNDNIRAIKHFLRPRRLTSPSPGAALMSAKLLRKQKKTRILPAYQEKSISAQQEQMGSVGGSLLFTLLSVAMETL